MYFQCSPVLHLVLFMFAVFSFIAFEKDSWSKRQAINYFWACFTNLLVGQLFAIANYIFSIFKDNQKID